jgi:hypothetical protein
LILNKIQKRMNARMNVKKGNEREEWEEENNDLG